jgi:hypothetical protein
MRLLTHGNQRTGRAGSSATELTLEEPIECTSLDRSNLIQVRSPAFDDDLLPAERRRSPHPATRPEAISVTPMERIASAIDVPRATSTST